MIDSGLQGCRGAAARTLARVPSQPVAPDDSAAPVALVALELAVQDPVGALIAARVGAARVELCTALGATGGITPSTGLLEATLDALRVTGDPSGTGVHVLVRPRPGGFVYDSVEVAVQTRDARAAVASGAAGVVVGALLPSGVVDAAAVRVLVEAARSADAGAEVTFHRAIDTLADPVAALDALAALGVTRVLTSGGAARAIDGLDQLAELAARGRELGVQIMAGGGVRPEDVAALVGAGVSAVHLSAKRVVVDDGGPGGGGDGGYETTDEAVATAAAEALRDALK